MKFLLGKKIGMSQRFRADGTVVPVTLISATPNTVTALRTQENDGYIAVQLGFGEHKKQTKPLAGHLKDLPDAIDVFYDGCEELVLKARFIKDVSTHGTGCTYSAAITAWLAAGDSLTSAVTKAKKYITKAIAGSRRIAGHTVLNSFWRKS